ncbi:MAG: hypothetical protein RL748_4128 [Pseudomonadota bacterium]|jgi:hypothetical protein
MNLHKITPVLLITLSALLCLLSGAPVLAGPGAHGPNGEHLDSPQGSHSHTGSVPRFETFTETFELVGQLHADELSILIDRYDSNEPVLNGQLEVELNGIKAKASFHADHGDYAVTDAKLLQALAKPGKHVLLFTVSAGTENDLLEATLEVGAHEAAPHANNHARWQGWPVKGMLVAGVVLALIFVVMLIARRRNPSNRK